MPPPTRPALPPVGVAPTPHIAQPALPIVPALKSSTGSEQPRRHMRRCYLTPEEMEQRRTAGLCYNCEEKFTPNHRCKRLFLLLSPSDNSDNEDSQDHEDGLEEPGISLYALIGIKPRASNTMQLWVKIGTTYLLALHDSGSTHNFINPGAAHRAGVCV